MRTLALAASLTLAPLVMGCAHDAASSSAKSNKPLYDRLGGKDAITAVVDSFVNLCATDNRINARFANADVPHLKAMLVEQICAASGGPCTYTGKDMKTAHTGMNISGDEFDALVDDLKKTLDKFKVAAGAQNDLLGALAPMKPDVVNQ
jgi:hemoglobin